MPFQSFQSGCGTCNASTDYADIYYSQDANLAASSVPPGPGQTGAGKKKRSTKKRTTTSKSKKSTTTKKRTSTKGKKRTMRGGASESFQLDDQFIRDNLGISFETVGGSIKVQNFLMIYGGKFELIIIYHKKIKTTMKLPKKMIWLF